jgi:hypothetical protein
MFHIFFSCTVVLPLLEVKVSIRRSDPILSGSEYWKRPQLFALLLQKTLIHIYFYYYNYTSL